MGVLRNMVTRMCRPAMAPSQGAESEPSRPGTLRWGDLRRVEPISRQWGWDRGLPVDRYYIEQFLGRHAGDIHGRVLEIQDNWYTKKFGGAGVVTSDVLHLVEGNPQATLVADLTRAEAIASDTYDCAVITQTLNRIYDMRAAVRTLHRILRPGGVLLATVPGISHMDLNEKPSGWYWGLTSLSIRQLFEEAFPSVNLTVEGFGNVLTACAFLQGIAMEELTSEELGYRDSNYDLLLTVRAVRDMDSREG